MKKSITYTVIKTELQKIIANLQPGDTIFFNPQENGYAPLSYLHLGFSRIMKDVAKKRIANNCHYFIKTKNSYPANLPGRIIGLMKLNPYSDERQIIFQPVGQKQLIRINISHITAIQINTSTNMEAS